MNRLFMAFRGLVDLLFCRRAQALVWLSSLLCALWVMGCGSVDPEPRPIPQEHVREVCWKPAPEMQCFFFPTDSGVAVATSCERDPSAELDTRGFTYKYSEDAPVQNLRLLPLSRVDAWCTRIPQPKALVVPFVAPCLEPAPMEEGRTGAKNHFGQTEVTPRSTLFCGKRPQMAPRPQDVILIRAKNEVYQLAYDQSRATGMALTQANAHMQSVTNKGDSWLKRTLTSDPGTIEQIQQRIMDALNSIEELPVYNDPILDGLAWAGYQAGFEDGKFEAEAKLFAIDAGILILEVVALEVAMGPLGGAKLLASAVSKGTQALAVAVKRLENIPIFIPGAAAGVGGFVRVGTIIKAAKRATQSKLAIALIEAKIKRPDGTDAHHIVAIGHKLAQKSRDILAKFGIKLDEAANGVFLPSNKLSPNPNGAIVHATLANNTLYYKKVEEYLSRATSQADVIRRLKRIRKTLENGTFYDAIP